MIIHLLNIRSQFSIEKYFGAVFNKSKNVSLILGCFGGFCLESLRGELTVTSVKLMMSQILYPKQALVYYDVCHNKCAGETSGSRNNWKSEGHFFIYQKRPENFAAMNHSFFFAKNLFFNIELFCLVEIKDKYLIFHYQQTE